jgi:hypothetical protein
MPGVLLALRPSSARWPSGDSTSMITCSRGKAQGAVACLQHLRSCLLLRLPCGAFFSSMHALAELALARTSTQHLAGAVSCTCYKTLVPSCLNPVITTAQHNRALPATNNNRKKNCCSSQRLCR